MCLYEVQEYLTADGVSPFSKWCATLDVQARVRIDTAVRRFYAGNLGDHKSVGGGVFETRIHTGQGFRVYYGRDGDELVLLLAGGSKKTQPQDVEAARDRWKDYKDRKRRGC